MRISRRTVSPETVVNIDSHDFSLKISLRTRLSKRHRRQILLALFRTIRPSFPHLFATHLCHEDSQVLDMIKEFTRPVSLYQSLDLQTPRSHEGFIIRTRRLGFSQSQEALAKLAAIDRARLSRIEHGHAKVSPLVRTKLELAFKKLEIRRHKKPQLPTRAGEVSQS